MSLVESLFCKAEAKVTSNILVEEILFHIVRSGCASQGYQKMVKKLLQIFDNQKYQRKKKEKERNKRGEKTNLIRTVSSLS